MASGEQAGERTEQASAKRREEARQRGQVAKSPDLTGAVLVLGALGVHAMAGGAFATAMLDSVRRGLSVKSPVDLTVDDAIAVFVATSGTIAHLVWPFVVIPAVLSIAAQLGQTRFAFSMQSLTPQWSRVNPFAGMGRLLSTRAAVDLVKAFLKLGIIGGVGYWSLSRDWPALLTLGEGGPEHLVGTVARVVWGVWLGIGVSYLLLSALDYGYQWWEHEKSLRMTKEEVRQETKETEGDPLLKSRARALHKQTASRRMMTAVKTADVVIRNPTHYAVAIKYDGGRMRAPRVVAKGTRLVAERIIALAQEHGVPVIENKPLARALYKAVKLGRDIPPDLYRAVAEVLAYVYSIRQGRR